jgi:hypothetical protein
MPPLLPISIQSDVACLSDLRALTLPAERIAPPYSSSFFRQRGFACVGVRDDGKRPSLLHC